MVDCTGKISNLLEDLESIERFEQSVGHARYSDIKREKILAQMESYLKKYLKKGEYASLLRSKQGLGLGFVDGDLGLL